MIEDPSTGGQDNEPEGELEVGDEDRLPWLEAVEEDEESDGPPVAKLIAAILIGLVAIGVIVGGLFWLGNRGEPGNNGDVIAAPEGEYKVRPDNPGGMNVSSASNVSTAASNGQQPQGSLNINGVEAPVAPAPAAPAPAAPTPAPAPPRPAPAPAAPSGPAIQLGAFSTQASANQAWGVMSRRYRYLAPLSHNVVPVQVGGRTLYRLRAGGAGAGDVCRRLRVAGEACTMVD
jgi:hypothetical protein